MNLQTLRNMRARYFMAGMTELVEAFDYMLQYVPRDESVENGAEKEVRAELEKLGLEVITVEWLDEDEMFEVDTTNIISLRTQNIKKRFELVDHNMFVMWVKPK